MGNYQVAVCDDNLEHLNDISGKIRQILDDNGASYTIEKYTSGKDILEVILNQKRKYDILFLDILMDEINGVVTARELRKNNSEASIVFITSSPNFVFKGYDVHALQYILKPVDMEKLTETILFDWNKKNEKSYLDIKLKQTYRRILFKDIYYLESMGRKVKIITANGDYEIYAKLSQLTEKLPSGQFINCHKSYTVNLDYVTQITKAYFTTRSGHVIPISKANYLHAKNAFINFIGIKE